MPLPATTRLFEIKLSGIDGLSSRFFGDVDRSTPTPNLRVANQENQDATSGTNRTMVGGIYNPFRRYGYLSAANNTFNGLTINSSSTTSFIVSCSIYDRINDTVFLGERQQRIASSAGFDSTDFAYVTNNLDSNNIITDMEIYQINGVRTLFFSFYATSDTFTVNHSTGVYTMAHNVYPSNGTPVTFSNSGGALPGNLVAGTVYYITNVSGFTFHVSATIGGADFSLSSDGSGVNTITGAFGGIGKFDLPYANLDATWATTTTTGAFNLGSNFHVMIPDASFLYVLDGASVHRIDGNTQTGGTHGTIASNVFYFPSYYNFVDGVDYRGNLFIATHNYSNNIRGVSNLTKTNHPNCSVVIWNKSDTTASNADLIPLPALKEIRKIYVSPTGQVRLIGVTVENITVIMEYDGSKFNHVTEVGYNAYPEYIDSFATASFFVTWLANDGNIYAHGLAHPDEKKEGIFIIGNKSDMVTGSTGGAILFGGSNTYSGSAGFKAYREGLILGYYDSTNYKLAQWDIYGSGKSGVTPVQHVGNVYTPVYYLTEVLGFTHYPSLLATLNYIQIYMAPTGGSGGQTVSTINLFLNQSTTPISFPITGDQAARGYYRMEVNQPYVNSVQLEVVWPGNSFTSPGFNDVAFSTAVLVYEPTNTKG